MKVPPGANLSDVFAPPSPGEPFWAVPLMAAKTGTPLDGKSPPVISDDLELTTQAEKLVSGAGKKRKSLQRVKSPSILEAIFAGVSLGFISVTISHLLLNQSCWGNGVKLREIRGRNGSDVYINICLCYIEYCS